MNKFVFSALLASSVLFMFVVPQTLRICDQGDCISAINCKEQVGNICKQCKYGYKLVDGLCAKKNYKKINIQSLDRKDQFEPRQITQDQLIQKLDQKIPQPSQTPIFDPLSWDQKIPWPSSTPILDQFSWDQKPEVYTYTDTGIQGSRISFEHNNFFMAFFGPYKGHGDVLLVPDDIWLAILMYFSTYVDDNAESLRHLFVRHQGKKTLTIQEQLTSVEQSLKWEKQWGYFFQEIIKEIRKNTLQGVVDDLRCDFSTTNEVYQLISTSVLMAAFKKYFEYEKFGITCGIENVYFDGTREDWVKVGEKLKNLRKYDVNGKLTRYTQAVGEIITKFIETYDGNPDKAWWNSVITTEELTNFCGKKDGTYVFGWILDLLGVKSFTHIDDIPKISLKVPIRMVNQLTQTQKELEMLVNWVSVSKLDKYTYKPDIGMCIVERSRRKIN